MSLFLRLTAALAVLALLCGCTAAAVPASSLPPEDPAPSVPAPAAQTAAPLRTIRIPYDPEDSLNPFTCVSLQNYYAAGLLYDTLVALDVVGSPQNRLAQEITLDGSSCIVKLRTDARFSDGSPVTAADVAYSALFAKECPRFAAQLAGLAEVQHPDSYTLVFSLLEPDRFFDRSLTFPIVKEETGEEPLPTGSGRFLPGSGEETVLLRNDRYYDPVEHIRTVRLVDAGPLLRQGEAVAEGELDLMYTDLRGTVDLSLGLGRRQVMLSNLVYLGVNSQRLRLPAELRAAFSGLLDRESIARRAYHGFAAAAVSPIKQSYSPNLAGEDAPTLEAQEELLEALGYGERDEEGWRTYQGRRFSLRLLVNAGSPDRLSVAAIVREGFEAAGFRLELETVPFEEYALRIAEGNYELYLGEMKLPGNLDLLSLIAPHESVGPGCVRDEELLELYRQAKAGEAELSALDAALRRVMPVIPLVYRRGLVVFSADFSANIVATEQDIFYNIGEW